jgi:hypothetical protein
MRNIAGAASWKANGYSTLLASVVGPINTGRFGVSFRTRKCLSDFSQPLMTP